MKGSYQLTVFLFYPMDVMSFFSLHYVRKQNSKVWIYEVILKTDFELCVTGFL